MIVSIIGSTLLIIGLWCMLSRSNIIKIIIGFSIIDTGIHIIMVGVGYIKDKTAPILDTDILRNQGASATVDPLPSALVLTAIVIGVAVTALMLSYAVRMYQEKKSLSIEDYQDLQC